MPPPKGQNRSERTAAERAAVDAANCFENLDDVLAVHNMVALCRVILSPNQEAPPELWDRKGQIRSALQFNFVYLVKKIASKIASQ